MKKDLLTKQINGVNYHRGYGKFRFSFSHYVVWRRCPLSFWLEHIDGYGEPFEGNIYTLFGSLLGDYVEKMFAREIPFQGIGKRWMIDFEKLCFVNKKLLDSNKNPKLRYSKKLVEEFTNDGLLIINTVRTKLKKGNKWSKYKFLAYEYKLDSKVPKEFSGTVVDDREYVLNENDDVVENEHFNEGIFFKGFIDLLLEDEDGNIILIDFKTATRPWDTWKRRDDNLKAQLKLYKYFYHLETGIPLDKIKTFFIVLPRKASKSHFNEIECKFGKRALENEMKKVNKFISDVYKKKMCFPVFSESNCKWCQFRKTKHCKNS